MSTEVLTFEAGMQELDTIVERLEAGGASISQTVEDCRRAKGLEQSLRGYLEQCQGEIKRIEANEGLPEITIGPGDEPPAAAPSSSSDDDIPF